MVGLKDEDTSCGFSDKYQAETSEIDLLTDINCSMILTNGEINTTWRNSSITRSIILYYRLDRTPKRVMLKNKRSTSDLITKVWSSKRQRSQSRPYKTMNVKKSKPELYKRSSPQKARFTKAVISDPDKTI